VGGKKPRKKGGSIGFRRRAATLIIREGGKKSLLITKNSERFRHHEAGHLHTSPRAQKIGTKKANSRKLEIDKRNKKKKTNKSKAGNHFLEERLDSKADSRKQRGTRDLKGPGGRECRGSTREKREGPPQLPCRDENTGVFSAKRSW